MGTNEAIARRWFKEVWCTPRRDESIDELMSADCELHGVAPQPLGREDFRRMRQHVLTRFPQFAIDVVYARELDDQVFLHAHVTGRHGESGQRIDFRGTAIGWIENGKIVKSMETWDFASLFIQIGALSPEAVTKDILGPDSR